MRRPTLLFAALLLWSPLAAAQTATPSAPQVPAPARPVAPTVPGAVTPEPRKGGIPAAQPGTTHDTDSLLRDLMDRHAAALPAQPRLPGNDAFGAVQEILAILEADPKTDWNRVNLDALRDHLIDMNEVTINARTRVEPVGGGIRVAVTGQGRTLEAIRRMVPAQARQIDGHDGWSVQTANLPDGVTLTVTARDAKQTAKIRGLGFIGVMATGAHHQMHHLAIARGQPLPTRAMPHGAMPKAN